MTGKTHFIAGAAAASAMCMTTSAASAVLAGMAGAAGGLLPDIDSEKSMAAGGFSRIIAALVIFIAVTAALFGMDAVTLPELPGGTGGYSMSAILMLVFCVIGHKQPHRGFTHSMLAVAALWCIWGNFI